MDFPGGPVVKNQPANAGDTDSTPGSGKIPLHLHSTTTEPQSPVLWIVAGGVVVVAIAGGALYFLEKKKKQGVKK